MKIKVKDLKKGDYVKITETTSYLSQSDAYLKNDVWTIDVGGSHTHTFTSNGDDDVDIYFI